jgi:glucose-1-phosphate adenylyltransferase
MLSVSQARLERIPWKMNVLCLILGGGRGTRLWPLTKDRAKPAVPIGGKYRLVDICVSNCLNSGMHHIAVLTQFNSVSLNRHIALTYHFDFFHTGWVQVFAAEQKDTITEWYQGTADAVRKHLDTIMASGARDILILAGDHLYRMDYSRLLQFHRAHRAAITVGVKPVGENVSGGPNPRKNGGLSGVGGVLGRAS